MTRPRASTRDAGPDPPDRLRRRVLPRPRAAQRPALAARAAAAGPGRLVRRRPRVRRPLRRGGLHRAADAGRRAGVLRRPQAPRPKTGAATPAQLKILPGFVPVIGSTEAEARALESRTGGAHHPRTRPGSPGPGARGAAGHAGPRPPAAGRCPPASTSGARKSRYQLIVEPGPARPAHRPPAPRPARRRPRATAPSPAPPSRSPTPSRSGSDAAAADGFNVMPAALPSGLETFVEHVIPILHKRGLFQHRVHRHHPARPLRPAPPAQPVRDHRRGTHHDRHHHRHQAGHPQDHRAHRRRGHRPAPGPHLDPDTWPPYERR